MKDAMQNHPNIKEKIISATISLIESSDGLVENITVRDIARQAGVAVGLINYHFASKKNLIEVCVQRIISHAMGTFAAAEHAADTRSAAHRRQEGMASFTARVFAFLLHHPEIAKISMLGDLAQPGPDSNSSVSYRAILKAIPDAEPENLRKTKAFMLLSTIQSAFLNRHISHELLGCDLNDEKNACDFFRLVTDVLKLM